MMQTIKYSLRTSNVPFSVGTIDLRQNRGKLDTKGCIALFVTSGCAIARVNFKKRPLRCGDFALLFYGNTFSIERNSTLFSFRYASFGYPIIEEAIYKPLSDLFWDVLYENPVFHTSVGQKVLLEAWWQQLQWMEHMENNVSQEEMLKNSIRNLLIATDTEVMRNQPDKARSNERSHAWMLILRFLSWCRCITEKFVTLHFMQTSCLSPPHTFISCAGNTCNCLPKRCWTGRP